ncbi:uncharacterized protein F54H12.2-like [Mauremys mutica]|uniref:Uncharacterized protein n=1 Tax=Mauremys mutica TaxID=74926 RepID=A0A9D4B786_9SAUR|nr:uncharacterized protein F54H12.2-like [Mauremys mutica]KAH1183000.1 hypothetical protein KIL84_004492 [Mauremys mutica]
MLLYVCCKVVKEDGSDIDDDARVALTNYPIATLFNQLDVTLGDRLISQSNNCYPYRGLIELILNYSHDTLATQFLTGGFHKDTAGAHENTLLVGAANEGFMRRTRLMASSRKLDLLGPLNSDLFFQEKLWLNGMDLKIKLTRSKDVFCLMSGNANQNYKVHIISVSLFVKRVKVTPGVHLGHAEALMTTNAKYPVDRVGIKVFSILSGSRVSNQENLFLGQLPKQLIICFIDHEAFSGSYIKNPFNFKHYNINFVALYVDGEQVPGKPLQPDFENGNCVREYMQLVQATGKYVKGRLLLINSDEFVQGYTLYAFDLTPDQECADHYSLIQTGNLRAEIRFALALPSTVNMIVYGVFDNVLEVNHRRNILFDYM